MSDVTIAGFDTGPVESAVCLIDASYNIRSAWKLPNDELLMFAMQLAANHWVIEGFRGMGKAVAVETFDACHWGGRFHQLGVSMGAVVHHFTRPQYLHPICGGRPPKGKSDATLYAAIKKRFGNEHVKLLAGCTDKRSAFALAVYLLDNIKAGKI